VQKNFYVVQNFRLQYKSGFQRSSSQVKKDFKVSLDKDPMRLNKINYINNQSAITDFGTSRHETTLER